MKKVFITRKIPIVAEEELKKHNIYVETYQEDNNPSEDLIIEHSKDKDAIISLLSDKISDNFFEKCNSVKIIANYAVGYNNIDLRSANENKVCVTNTPGVLTNATADLAFSLLLSASRRIVEGDKFCRADKFKGWGALLMLGKELTGKTIGIIGAGRIGQAMGKRAFGFDMNIIYYNRSAKTDFENKYNAKRVNSLEELLQKSDFISIHIPLTDETRYLIKENEFNMMKDEAVFINTARGDIVNEQALYQALKSGKLFSAGLDVFEKEPLIYEGLLELDNVVLAPHVGSGTVETRDEMAKMAARNIIDFFNGKKPPNLVNNEAWK